MSQEFGSTEEVPEPLDPGCEIATRIYDKLLVIEAAGKLDERHGPALLAVETHKDYTGLHHPDCFMNRSQNALAVDNSSDTTPDA